MDQPTATVVAALGSALVVGIVTAFSNAKVGSRHAAKTEGVITTEIKSVTDRMDRRDAEINKKFDDVSKEDDQQWKLINEHTAEIGYLKGRANGKATH